MNTSTKMSHAKRYTKFETLSILGSKSRIGPIGLCHYAKAFLEAACSLPTPQDKFLFEPVRPYLICHSIELGLKSFLSLRGMKMIGMLDKHGHKLDVLLNEADRQGLADLVILTDTQRSEILRASDYYNGKVFEYPAFGEALEAYPKMPHLEPLFEAALILVEKLHQPCLEA